MVPTTGMEDNGHFLKSGFIIREEVSNGKGPLMLMLSDS